MQGKSFPDMISEDSLPPSFSRTDFKNAFLFTAVLWRRSSDELPVLQCLTLSLYLYLESLMERERVEEWGNLSNYFHI